MEKTKYKDQEGNLYFVRFGIGGDTFKGFRRCVVPKKGQRKESDIRGPFLRARQRTGAARAGRLCGQT